MTNRRLLFIIVAAAVILGVIFIQLRQEGDESSERETTATTQVTTTPSSWPWYLSRSFGIASFVLLFFSAVIGMMMTTGIMHRVLSPASSWSLHRTTGIVLILSIALHLCSLLFDRFVNLGLLDLLVPFYSSYQRLYLSLGIIGFYIFIPVIWSSLFWVDKYSKLWRTTHVLSFLMYFAVFIHSLFIGTDTHQPWMLAIYWSTGLIMGGLILYRLIWKLRADSKPM